MEEGSLALHSHYLGLMATEEERREQVKEDFERRLQAERQRQTAVQTEAPRLAEAGVQPDRPYQVNARVQAEGPKVGSQPWLS
jgi:hypothetical protein